MVSRKVLLTAMTMLWTVPAIAAEAEGGKSFDSPMIGEVLDYKTSYEDTFIYLARDYGLGYVEMRAANPGVDPWVPGAGVELVLPTGHLLPDAPREGIVINIPEMRIYSYVEKDREPQTFPIGIGREGLETPQGETSVVRKAEGPVWRPTPRMRKEDPDLKEVYYPGPENPMGTHALYLGWPQYAIHGTNRPFGIGRRVSSGCIRMYPKDIVTFFSMVPIGTQVRVINQPVKMAWVEDELMIEAHPTVDQAVQVEEVGVLNYEKIPEEEIDRILTVAGSDYKDIDWEAVRKVYGLRLGYPVPVAQRHALETAEVTVVENTVVAGTSAGEPVKAEFDLGKARAEADAHLAAIYARELELAQNINKGSVVKAREYSAINP